MSHMPTPPPPLVLQWDLSGPRGTALVGWPADSSHAQHFWKGDIRLTLRLPGRVISADLADIRAERRGEELSVLALRGRPLSLDDAVAEVERRMAELDLPRRDLDQWREDVRSGDFRKDRVFATRRNDLTPALSLEVRHSYDEERPWYLSWEIAWPDLAPRGPSAP